MSFANGLSHTQKTWKEVLEYSGQGLRAEPFPIRVHCYSGRHWSLLFSFTLTVEPEKEPTTHNGSHPPTLLATSPLNDILKQQHGTVTGEAPGYQS